MKIVPALLAAALLSLASAEGATLRLDMLSEPGDRIGQGKTGRSSTTLSRVRRFTVGFKLHLLADGLRKFG